MCSQLGHSQQMKAGRRLCMSACCWTLHGGVTVYDRGLFVADAEAPGLAGRGRMADTVLEKDPATRTGKERFPGSGKDSLTRETLHPTTEQLNIVESDSHPITKQFNIVESDSHPTTEQLNIVESDSHHCRHLLGDVSSTGQKQSCVSSRLLPTMGNLQKPKPQTELQSR
jgi:hypothetical protein